MVRGLGPISALSADALADSCEACWEWQLLLSASRASVRVWEFSVAIRPVIGLLPV